MATGSEVVAAKLFWAVGYHTAEYHIAQLVPSNLEIGPDTKITPPGETKRKMHQGDIAWLLSRADREPDGSYRVIAARRRPAARSGASASRHARRRSQRRRPARASPRAARLFRVRGLAESRRCEGHQLAVVAHYRERPSFIRHYLLDFGSTLGSAAIGRREGWEGSSRSSRRGDIVKRALAFGLKIPVWRTRDFFESPSIGRLPPITRMESRELVAAHHQRRVPPLRADDTFWAATSSP